MPDKKDADVKDKDEVKSTPPSNEPTTKRFDLGLLEEDDEFEEFPTDEWQQVGENEEQDDVNVWEDNWDDDTIEDDFAKQLRSELEKQAKK